jgi:hypothetical protein
MAGQVVVGPNAPAVEFELNGPRSLNYQTMMLGGYSHEQIVNNEVMMMATMKSFIVLGNPIRLMRVMPQQGPMPIPPEDGIPQGPILIWQGETGMPMMTDDDGVYSIHLAFAVLPPFAQVTSPTTLVAVARLEPMAPQPYPRDPNPPHTPHTHGPGGHTHDPAPAPAASPADPRRGRVPPRR